MNFKGNFSLMWLVALGSDKVCVYIGKRKFHEKIDKPGPKASSKRERRPPLTCITPTHLRDTDAR
jgi:hypothetical protein